VTGRKLADLSPEERALAVSIAAVRLAATTGDPQHSSVRADHAARVADHADALDAEVMRLRGEIVAQQGDVERERAGRKRAEQAAELLREQRIELEVGKAEVVERLGQARRAAVRAVADLGRASAGDASAETLQRIAARLIEAHDLSPAEVRRYAGGDAGSQA
jgi:hypothetical protein